MIKDIKYDRFPHWWQRRVVWFWDDNLTAKRSSIRELLTAMIPLRKWWLTQASMDIANDDALLDLMEESGCIGIFFGIESFDAGFLRDAHKPQNKISTYRTQIRKLHDRGICVMAGFNAGFDSDTLESIAKRTDAVSWYSRLQQTGGRGKDSVWPRLGVLQRIRRFLPTSTHVA